MYDMFTMFIIIVRIGINNQIHSTLAELESPKRIRIYDETMGRRKQTIIENLKKRQSRSKHKFTINSEIRRF
jgi:hypothetical protein